MGINNKYETIFTTIEHGLKRREARGLILPKASSNTDLGEGATLAACLHELPESLKNGKLEPLNITGDEHIALEFSWFQKLTMHQPTSGYPVMIRMAIAIVTNLIANITVLVGTQVDMKPTLRT